jgi:hypothetical protein
VVIEFVSYSNRPIRVLLPSSTLPAVDILNTSKTVKSLIVNS